MICITGANGWLGLSLVELISKNGTAESQQVRALVLPGSDITKLQALCPTIKIYEGDLTIGSGLGEFFHDCRGGTIIHTAGIIHPKRVLEFYKINRDGTRRLLDAAVAAGLRRAVVVSSNSPCGCNPHPDHLFDEDSPYNPYMNYGRSKMEMESLSLDMHHRGLIEIVIIRAPWFYGPNQPPRQKLFFEMVRDGKAPVVGSGENLRSMAYTENLAQGLMLAAQVPKAAGQIYWIADERPYSMNEIIDTIERLLETEFSQKCFHKRMWLPSIVSEVALFIDSALQNVGLYHQKFHVLSEMNKSIACRIDKANKELGYNPQISLEEGMRRSLGEIFPLKRGAIL
jgi:nucleoside-diphosphate-sugar epimerase